MNLVLILVNMLEGSQAYYNNLSLQIIEPGPDLGTAQQCGRAKQAYRILIFPS
jgi:hypothetical protein